MATINTVPPKLDITCYGGDDTRFSFTFLQDDGETPYELVGTHSAQIRVNQNSDDFWELEVLIDDPATGLAYLAIPSEVTEELVVDATEESIYVDNELITAPMFKGVWDWQFVDGVNTRTLVQGEITIIGEVTR